MKWVGFIVGMLVALVGTAQVNEPERLEERLATQPADSSRVRTLLSLAAYYLPSKPLHARELASEALTLSRQLPFPVGEVLAITQLAEFEFRQSNYAKAVEMAHESLKKAEHLQDTLAMAWSYRLLGIINTFGFQEYDEALAYGQAALRIYQRKKAWRKVAGMYGNITWIYGVTGQRLKEGQQLADEGLKIATNLNDLTLRSYLHNSKGILFRQQGQLDSALWHLARSSELGLQANDLSVITYNRINQGGIYNQTQRFNEALSTFQQALDESFDLNLREVTKEAHRGMAQAYEGLNKPALAYSHFKQYAMLKDSLVNSGIVQRTLAAEMATAQARNDARMAELQLENDFARRERLLYQIAIGAVILFMSAILILMLRNSRQRRRSNRELEAKNRLIAQSNQELQQANEAKDRIFAVISHDLRSPLHSLKGLLELTFQNHVSADELRTHLPAIHRHVINLYHAMENLLQWSYGQRNGWRVQPAMCHLHELVTKNSSLFQEAAATKGIELVNEVATDHHAFVDPNHLEIICRNLISNSVKFTPPGGEIRLTSERENGHVVFRVSDTGVGMDAQRVEQLFTERIDKSARGTGGEKGTGIGLMLCKEIAERNGGRITVRSEPGHGTTFTVLLRSSAA
jgi:signal transduction histidine kinase